MGAEHLAPPSGLDKLGVKTGVSVRPEGTFGAGLAHELDAAGAVAARKTAGCPPGCVPACTTLTANAMDSQRWICRIHLFQATGTSSFTTFEPP